MNRDAVLLGTAFGHPDLFADECANCSNLVLVTDLVCVAAALSSHMHNPASYRAYVADHILVSSTRRAFFCRVPLDHMLLSLKEPGALEQSGNVFPLFQQLCRYEECRARVASALLPEIIKMLPHTRYLEDACFFLTRLGEDEETRAMLHDPDLFYALSKNIPAHTDAAISVLYASEGLTKYHVVFPLVLAVADVLRRTRDTSTRLFRVCFHVVASCSCMEEWKAALVSYVVAHAHSGWPPPFEQLLCNMLDGPSTSFLLELHTRGCLTSLIRRAYAATLPGWETIRNHLKHQWPGMVALVMNLEDRTVPKTSYCCPITLEPCVHPVVASDGHTYERNALLTHMTNHTTSPITRQNLLPLLYDNHAW